MTPSALSMDIVNRCCRYAVIPGDSAMSLPCRKSFSDCFYLLLCQLVVVIALSSGNPAVANGVSDVFQSRSPCQIGDAVVHQVSIQVPAFHSFRAWSNKGFQNNRMKVLVAPHTTVIKTYPQIPGMRPGSQLVRNSGWTENSGAHAPNIAVRACKVIRESRHWTGIGGKARMVLRHDLAPCSKACLEDRGGLCARRGPRCFRYPQVYSESSNQSSVFHSKRGRASLVAEVMGEEATV